MIKNEEMRYRMIFENDIKKRVKINYYRMEDVMELDDEELEEEDFKYLISLKEFIKLKPFSEAYCHIENLPNEFTDMDAKYVEMVVIHKKDKETSTFTQIIYMQTDKEKTSNVVWNDLPIDQFWDYGWDVMPCVSMVICNRKIIADFTK